MDRTQTIYTVVGTVGVFLAHGIENRIQFKDNPEDRPGFFYPHVNRVAFYWTLGAIGYWVLLNRGLVRF
ncbi:MAG: hypothetical protein CL581_14115 [Alteromonadaceae bacterium]|nr:hypothetical protein [Alteromonadaceae bacterium]